MSISKLQEQELRYGIKQHIEKLIGGSMACVSEDHLRHNSLDYDFDVSQEDIDSILSNIKDTLSYSWTTTDLTDEQYQELREGVKEATQAYVELPYEDVIKNHGKYCASNYRFKFTNDDVKRIIETLDGQMYVKWKD